VHQAGFLKFEHPLLTVTETGVPALRHRLYLLPAEGKLNDTIHIVEHQLPCLINSFQLYCFKSHFTRKAELDAIISKPKDDIHNILNRMYLKLKGIVRKTLLDPMTVDETEWIKEARALCEKWGAW
jgi:hypothetical protein